MRSRIAFGIGSFSLWFLPKSALSAGSSDRIPLSVWINVLLLIPVLIVLFPKILEMFGVAPKERHDKMRIAVDEAEKLRLLVEKMVKDYEAKLSGLESERQQILEEARAAGQKERAKILARTQRLAEKIREDALRAAAKEVDRSKAKLRKELIAQAALQAAEILRSRITEKDHEAFSQQLVTHLEESRG